MENGKRIAVIIKKDTTKGFELTRLSDLQLHFIWVKHLLTLKVYRSFDMY